MSEPNESRSATKRSLHPVPSDVTGIRFPDDSNHLDSGSDGPTQLWDEPAAGLAQRVCEQLAHDDRFTPDLLREVQRVITEVSNEASGFHNDIDDIAAGKRIGQYVIENKIGEGGGGQVFAAVHQTTLQPVAIKVLRRSMANRRFRREMDLVKRVAHPHIVVAFEVGVTASFLYIVMQRLPGPDIGRKIRDSGPMNWKTTLPFVRQIASALQQAHGRGLVHRDVKPGNLILDAAGEVQLTDLGLAIIQQSEESGEKEVDDQDRSFITLGESLGGTPGYMAPEQAHSLAAADARSDIYSLGATWFFMLTGRAMVPGETWSGRLQQLIAGTDIETLDQTVLPSPYLELWQSMVRRDPGERLQSIAEVSRRLANENKTDQLAGDDRTIRVLVVEDDQDDLYITMQSLKRFNHSVHMQSADGLGAAFLQLDAVAFDVVLLDLELTETSGLETLREFRRRQPDVPVIILSGRANDGIAADCREWGAREFVAKHSLGVHELERLIFETLAQQE